MRRPSHLHPSHLAQPFKGVTACLAAFVLTSGVMWAVPATPADLAADDPANPASPTPASTSKALSFDYALRGGYDTNLFGDTSKLRGTFLEEEAKLRGSVDLEGGELSYGLWHRERQVEHYSFGNEHVTGASLGFKTKLGDRTDFSIEGGISRDATGDVLIAVPGSVIGYRSTDMNYSLASSLSSEFLGGKNTLTASVEDKNRGKAKFTTDLLLPGKVEADVTALDVTASHIRPALSGEVGFTLAYRQTFVPSSEQMTLLRFPASSLRGSIAYGRKLGENVAVIAEGGITGISADQLGSDVRQVRPYLRASLEWQATNRLQLAIGYDRDFAITDLDDPLGEYIGTLKLAAGLKLTDSLDAKLVYELASSDWLYYVYNTRTRRLTGTLTWQFAKDHKLEFEYRRVDRDETDPAQNFTGNQYFTRVSGTF